jgi:murein tripeptide amidase MpaA
MRDLQKQYSHLADIESIGKSRMGRDQLLMTVTAKSTGATTPSPPCGWTGPSTETR